MSTVMRCKMICNHVAHNEFSSPENPTCNVQFGAVWEPEGGGEDSIYGKYTPMANFVASISSPVAEKLEVGSAYYLDFSKV